MKTPPPLPDSAWADLAEKAAGDAAKLATLARAAEAAGRQDQAYGLASAARAAAPNDPAILAETAQPLAASTPDWHVWMLKEAARNQAYADAIARAVKPGMRVLDIGAGSGLLAMLAARAGAGHVFTCEANPAIADAAAEIVKRNGFADRVTVIAKHSQDLDAEADLGGRVDLLVSEVIGSTLLGEGVLSTLEDARARLLLPGAPMIPVGGEVRVAPAFWDDLADTEVGEILGFDLSPFNRLVATPRRINAGRRGLTLAGEPATLFDFDFRQAGPTLPDQRKVELTAGGGLANGVVQWIRIRLDDHTTYENMPGTLSNSAWYFSFYPFATPRRLAAGEKLTVHGRHSSDRVWLWSDA